MITGTILFIAPGRAREADHMRLSGCSVAEAHNLETAAAGMYAAALCDAGLISTPYAAAIERLRFLSNDAPIVLCAESPVSLSPVAIEAVRAGACECLYYPEFTQGLAPAHIERILRAGVLAARLKQAQQTLLETARLKYDLSLRDSIVDHERRLNANILASITSGMVILDVSGMIMMLNDAAQRLLGLDDGGNIGSHFHTIFPRGFSEAVDAMVEKATRLHERTATGTIRLGGLFLRVSAYLIQEESGTQRGRLLLIEDITEQEQTAMQLVRAEKLATLGTMLTGISHELRNPLSIISACAQRGLLKKERDNEWIRKNLDSILRQTERCAGIVNSMLDFTRHTTTAAGAHPLSDMLDEALGYISYQNIFDNITVEKRYGDGLSAVGDRSRFVQVFLNLIQNAADAMEGRGVLTIATRRDGRASVIAEIHDTGGGIDPSVQGRVFDPFFSTKDPGRGTGLGLAICQKIAMESRGDIWFKSKPGATSFFVKLPCPEDAPYE